MLIEIRNGNGKSARPAVLTTLCLPSWLFSLSASAPLCMHSLTRIRVCLYACVFAAYSPSVAQINQVDAYLKITVNECKNYLQIRKHTPVRTIRTLSCHFVTQSMLNLPRPYRWERMRHVQRFRFFFPLILMRRSVIFFVFSRIKISWVHLSVDALQIIFKIYLQSSSKIFSVYPKVRIQWKDDIITN